MIRTCALVAGLLASCLSVDARADQILKLMATAGGGTADLAFKTDMRADDAFMIRLSGIAAPGSRVKISVDRGHGTLYDGIVTPAQCDFTEGAATCAVPIGGGSDEFIALVKAFKAGLVAHVEITNAGSPPMTADTSLIGFTKTFTAL